MLSLTKLIGTVRGGLGMSEMMGTVVWLHDLLKECAVKSNDGNVFYR